MEGEAHHIIDKIYYRGKKLGIDWIEIRVEDTVFEYIQYMNNRLREASLDGSRGIGIRVMVNGSIGFASTSGFKTENAYRALETAIKIARTNPEKTSLAEVKGYSREYRLRGYRHHPMDIGFREKLDLVKRLSDAIYDRRLDRKIPNIGRIDIETSNIRFGAHYGNIIVYTSDGINTSLYTLLTGIVATVLVSDGARRGESFTYIGTSMGMDPLMDLDKIDKMGVEAYTNAVEKAYAGKAPPGLRRVITSPDVSGVFAHESFGHMSEGDYGATASSPLSGKVGEEIGSINVSIYDSGIPPTRHGFYYPVDSEGVESKTVTLIEKGIFKGFMHSRETALLMGTSPTGNGRAQDYNHPPIVRMRNTYFGPGDWHLEEMIREARDGVIVYDERGGQAELDGTFTFTALRGYIIDKGELRGAVRDVTLTGNIFEMLREVTGATREIEIRTLPFGGCGKDGQGVYVGLGGPYLLVERLRIGGG